MLIRIKPTDSSLPFISELPALGIAQLEGYNGVGKSLTISILELCAGNRLTMEKEAWKGLCDGIGRLVVTATDLDGAESIEWTLDGASLFAASGEKVNARDPGLDWFVDIRVDGQPPSSLDEIRSIFGVERINGDVGLREQIATRADRDRRATETAAEKLLESPKYQSVEERVASLSRLLEGLSLAEMRSRADAFQRLCQAHESAQVESKAATDVLAKVEAAVKLRGRLDELATGTDQLDLEVLELQDEIQPVKEARDKTAKDLAAAEKAATQSSDVREQLSRATDRYRRANSRHRKLTKELAEASQVAEIEDDQDVDARKGIVLADLEILRRRRVELDAGPAVRSLIDSVSPPINKAAASPLAEQALLSSPSRASGSWTIAEVSEALHRRFEELQETPPPHEAVGLDEEIEKLTNQLAALEDVADLRAKREKAGERLNEAQEESMRLSEKLDQAATDRLEQLRTSRRNLDEKLSELGGRLAVLTYRQDKLGDPQSRDAMAAKLKGMLGELGVAEGGLDELYAKTLGEAEEKRTASLESKDAERLAGENHERDIVDLERVGSQLRDDDSFEWLRTGSIPVPGAKSTMTETVDLLDRLGNAVAAMDRRLTGIRRALPGIGASLGAVADKLRNREPRAEFRLDEVFGSLEQETAEWFAVDVYREALLGPGATDVGVDLRELQVSWAADGTRHTKPIEALSSGERAFAFTQARLARLQEETEPAQNRLIALDEFGAFVSADRIDHLVDYLRGWHQNHPSDELLVVLPATRDYEAMAKATDGKESERFLRMAEKLAEQGWFVEKFEGR